MLVEEHSRHNVRGSVIAASTRIPQLNTIQGDLLELAVSGRFDVVIHGCNCQCTMGAGIAASIKSRFPEAYEADCATVKSDASKLGTFTSVTIKRTSHHFTIVNAYTQLHWRGKGVLADYDAIRLAFKNIRSTFPDQRLGYPRIGAGLAKGDWQLISTIIAEELDGEDHTLVEFAPSM